MAEALRLYGFWRSAATFRVRAALNLKGIAYEEVPINLDGGEQNQPAYRAVNPDGSVPALVEPTLVKPGGNKLTQSLAILEYLEERYPETPLLPRDLHERARVRSLADLIACDSHPLIVPRVREWMIHEAELGADQWRAWQTQWFGAGMRGMEARLVDDPATGRFCHGGTPTIADLCLVSLALGVRVFKLDTGATPTVDRIVEACLAEEAFARAHPLRQVGAPKV